MASRNGLNPKIRGPKGVGFGRALPSAFGFGNGITPNTTGSGAPLGYLDVVRLAGAAIPNKWSIEFWLKPAGWPVGYEGFLQYNDNHPTGSGEGGGAETRLQFNANDGTSKSFQYLMASANVAGGITPTVNLTFGARNHIVITIDTTTTQDNAITCVLNGNVSSKSAQEVVVIGGDPYTAIFEFFYLFVLTTQGLYSTIPTDEFRMYNAILTDEQIVQNWNNGIGNNPSITEDLFLWYKFEQFESLDFSMIQDGSDLRVGIRDLSGKNYHAQSIDLITDPTDDNYCLSPF